VLRFDARAGSCSRPCRRPNARQYSRPRSVPGSWSNWVCRKAGSVTSVRLVICSVCNAAVPQPRRRYCCANTVLLSRTSARGPGHCWRADTVQANTYQLPQRTTFNQGHAVHPFAGGDVFAIPVT
jgi:hypothetical protein